MNKGISRVEADLDVQDIDPILLENIEVKKKSTMAEDQN